VSGSAGSARRKIMTIVLIYISIALLLSIIGIFWSGYCGEEEEEALPYVMFSFSWPVLLAILPFYGIYLLGAAFNKNKRKK
jgi:FtsH-binding integral membrane protein